MKNTAIYADVSPKLPRLKLLEASENRTQEASDSELGAAGNNQ